MLRNQVEVQRVSYSDDGMGGSTKTWNKVQDAWMRLKPLSGNERMQAMRLEATISHRAHSRADVDVKTEDRIVFDSRVFNVKAVLDLEERGKFYELDLEEGVAT